jgi:glycosyltransferase involved in cell wall biosynthesis
MYKPLVSIIIPCYNYAKFVSDAIESALNQTYKNIELVIINDGSTDNSKEIILKYINLSNVIYLEQKNVGLAISRNNGIEKSKGEIILCLDADDWINPHYIENIVKNLTDYKTIVTTDLYLADEFLNITEIIPYYPTTYEKMLNQNYINGCAGFSKKLFMEVGGYDPKLTKLGYEDWDLWIRMMKVGAKSKVINSEDKTNPFFKYRKHGNSMVSNAMKKHDEIYNYMKTKYIQENYYMDLNYKTNPEIYFDDTNLSDEWQNEIYAYAKQIVKKNNHKTILDFGCGSGYKLIKFFDEYQTIGLDLPKTVNFLKEKYPNKIWKDNLESIECDIFIASDVIEHMKNPNILLNFIKQCNPKDIIISTPDRNLHRNIIKNGPPENIHHIREWSFQEFENYIGSNFKIVTHLISNKKQATQMIHCKML